MDEFLMWYIYIYNIYLDRKSHACDIALTVLKHSSKYIKYTATVGYLSLRVSRRDTSYTPIYTKNNLFQLFLFLLQALPCFPTCSKAPKLEKLRAVHPWKAFWEKAFPRLESNHFPSLEGFGHKMKIEKTVASPRQWCWMTLLCSNLIRLHLFDLILQFQPSIYGRSDTQDLL